MPLKRFLSHLQFERRYSPHTLLAYESDISRFASYLSAQYEMTDFTGVTHSHVRSWIVSLMESGMSSRSVNRKITSLKSFFRFMLREKMAFTNPMARIQAPKVGKRLPAFIDESKMATLFDSIIFEEGFPGVRDRTILDVFYGTGIRLSELVNLRLADFDPHNQSIKVLGKRNKERIVPISGLLLESMRSYIDAREIFLAANNMQSESIFIDNRCNKIYPKFVYRMVRRYLGMITTAEGRHPHVLRHTFATHMLNHGADINAVKELLGHANLSATQVYTHNTVEKLKNVYRQAHPKA